MFLLLPDRNLTPEQMMPLLATNALAGLRSAASIHKVDVLLPKFQMGAHFSVKDTLGVMGVKKAFDKRQANFDRMILQKVQAFRIYLSEIYQDAWIEVEEKGTKAAAATTSVHYSLGCGMPAQPPPAIFHADHPFLYFIVHNPSRCILFAGWVVNPTSQPVSEALK